MVDNIITKPLGLVLIVTAHMVFNGPCKTGVTGITGIIGSNITLTFTFVNAVLTHNSHLAVYTKNEIKIAECQNCSARDVFEVYPKNTSVLYRIKNLTQGDSGEYWVSLFGGTRSPLQSNKVKLDVQEENRSSTVPPVPTQFTKTDGSGSSDFLSFHIVIFLMVLPIVLLTAVLPCVIWCLMRSKDKQPQQNSTLPSQETIESIRVPPPSVIYSVLDFPKRPSANVEINQNDTEYAAVGYLSENRQM